VSTLNEYRVFQKSVGLAAGALFCSTITMAQSEETAAILLEAEHQVTRILSVTGDPAFGAYLAGECATCHQSSGDVQGIPPIKGLPADYTVQALVEYRLGIRASEVMQLMAARLEDDEIAALAAHFADQGEN
jgi:cytochrome c553